MATSWMRPNQYRTLRRSSKTHMGAHTSSKLTSQMPTIKLNLTKRHKIFAQSTNLWDCLGCAYYLRDLKKLLLNLPELRRIKSERNQGRYGVWNYQGAARQESACSRRENIYY